MKREILTTADGSNTIKILDWDEQYHSLHGAIQEAEHVFIKYGFQYYVYQEGLNKNLSILEIGFGTALNALVTYKHSLNLKIKVTYVGVEAYPVSIDEASKLNFSELLGLEPQIFNRMHSASWDETNIISEGFELSKIKMFFQDIDYCNKFDLIYFDAFGPRVQPELWEESMFKKMYNALKVNGILVTYSAKGSVRRAMQASGFTVERLPGPPGKREMLRAIKI